MMLNTKIRDLKQQGKQKVQHKPAITEPDLQKLGVHPVLSPSDSAWLTAKCLVPHNSLLVSKRLRRSKKINVVEFYLPS